MNPQGTSFIPQRQTQRKQKNHGVRKIYILAYVSYVLFFGTVFAAGGTFFYKYTLDSQLENKKSELATERTNFNQADIESVRELSDRIYIAKEKMDGHVSVLSIFEALENSSSQALTFRKFSYKRPEEAVPLVTLTGEASNFNSLLFQREVLDLNPVFSGADFAEVALNLVTDENQDSNAEPYPLVTFEISKDIDPSLIGYIPRVSTESIVEQSDTQTVDIQDGTSLEVVDEGDNLDQELQELNEIQ
jgi:hypothetical protein